MSKCQNTKSSKFEPSSLSVLPWSKRLKVKFFGYEYVVITENSLHDRKTKFRRAYCMGNLWVCDNWCKENGICNLQDDMKVVGKGTYKYNWYPVTSGVFEYMCNQLEPDKDTSTNGKICRQ